MKDVYNFKRNAARKAIIRAAMAGTPWLIYRNLAHWWKIQDLEQGQDPSWNRWVEGDPKVGLESKPSMNGALQKIRSWYYNKKIQLMAIYGVSEAEIDEMFQCYVLYDPASGVYLKSDGPYTAEKPAWDTASRLASRRGIKLDPNSAETLLELANLIPDTQEKLNAMAPNDPLLLQVKEVIAEKAQNKQLHSGLTAIKKNVDPLKEMQKVKSQLFEVRSDLKGRLSYFTQRFGKTTKKELMANIQLVMKDVLTNFGIAMGPEDIKFVAPELPPDEVKKLGSENAENIQHVYKNLGVDANGNDTPELQALLAEAPILAPNSFVALSASGVNKILQKACKDNNWEDVYEEAIKSLAAKNKMTVDQVKEHASTNEDMIDQLKTQLVAIKRKLVKAKDPKAQLINIPTQKVMGYEKVGAQRTEAFRVKTIQKNIMNFRVEILKAIVDIGSADPTKLSERLNISRKGLKTKAKGVWTSDLINGWLHMLEQEGRLVDESGNVVGHKSYKTLLKENLAFEKQQDKMYEQKEFGFDSLKASYRISSAAFAATPEEYVDKAYRIVMNAPDPNNHFAKGDEGYGHYEEITCDRLVELRLKADASGKTLKEREQFIRSEILKQIGDNNKIEETTPKVLYEAPDLSTLIDQQFEEEEQESNPTLLDVDNDVVNGEVVAPEAVLPEEAVKDVSIEKEVEQEELTPEQEAEDFQVSEVPPYGEAVEPELGTEFDINEVKPQEKIDLLPDQSKKIPQQSTPVPQAIKPKPTPKVEEEDDEDFDPFNVSHLSKSNIRSIVSNSIQNLIKIARDLDIKGKEKDAEEIHQIIRKYQNRL